MRVWRKLSLPLTAVIVSGLVTTVPAHAASVRNVPADYATISAALAASSEGDTVLVAPGVYVETINVPGGITVESSGGADVTTLDGNRNGTTAIVNGTVRGLTIRGGGSSNLSTGGAIVNGLLEDSRLIDNYACFIASAAYVNGGGILRNNYISDNFADCTGASVVTGIGQIVGNEFAHNNNHPDIDLNNQSPTIEGNYFHDAGQAIGIINSSSPLIRNNLFVAPAGAGTYQGVLQWDVPCCAAPTIVNNTLILEGQYGTLVYGGGFDTSVTFANNVVVVGEFATTLNCASGYDNLPPNVENNDFRRPSGSGLVGLCANAGGTNGNVSVSPAFVADATGDYHLRPDSPLIDAGLNGIAMAADIDGDARPFDGDENGTATVDIGFDEAIDPLLVDPGFYDYGDVPLAKVTHATVTLTNLGSSPLTISSVTLGGPDAADFAIVSQTCTGGALAVGADCAIPVDFTPSSLNQMAAELAINGPGDVGTRTVALVGTGIDPITVAPPEFNFADTTVGSAALPGTITVSNAGPPVTVTSVTVTGANAADIDIGTETCTSGPMAMDGSCTIPFTFRAANSGDRTAEIVISGPAPVGTRIVSISGHAWPPSSHVTWGSVLLPGPMYTWNGGNALGRTVQSGTQRLHLLYATDRVNGKWATDSGPKVGVYYIRSSSGTSWTTPLRLNPTSQHAAVMGLTAAGSKVYAIWVSQTRWVNYSGTAPRVLYVRINSSHGAAGSWGSTKALTSTTGRVDYPTIAATGTDAHIAFTNGVTGSVIVASTRNGGSTWTKTTLGSSTIALSDGRSGFPTVSANGTTVVVCWLSDINGTIKCRISTNRGVSWAAAVTVGSGATGYFSVAVRGSRIAVAWTTGTGVVFRQRINGTWQSAASIATPYGSTFGAQVVLQDPNRIAVYWSDNQGDFTYVMWAESSDGGHLWYAWDAPGSAGSSHWGNAWPSVVWPSPSTRYVAWYGWTNNIPTYRLFFRKGVGTPSGPFAAVVPWVAGPATPSVIDPEHFGSGRP